MSKKRAGNSQGLSPQALADKRARDLAAANSPDREKKRAENQRIGQRPDSDLHHVDGKVGEVKRMSIRNNRGDSGDGTKNDKQ